MVTNTMRLAAAIAGVGFLLSTAGMAQAVPASQARCALDAQSITTSSGLVPIPGLALIVNNGRAARTAIVQLSADMGVDAGAEVRVAYSVDGGSPREGVFGPANLANHQEFFEARSVIAVIPLPAGTHTVTPFWRVSGPPGKNAFIDNRCATLEVNTR